MRVIAAEAEREINGSNAAKNEALARGMQTVVNQNYRSTGGRYE